MSHALIFPHQLYKNLPALTKAKTFTLVEDPLYFRQYPFHKQKLLLHRATMQAYGEYLKKKGYAVRFIEARNIDHSGDIVTHLKDLKSVTCLEPDDNWLRRRISRAAAEKKIEITWVDNPGFVTPISFSKAFFERKKSYFMASYYQEQRKRLDVLLEDGKPVGGKWSYDAENRKKLPKGLSIPDLPKLRSDRYLNAAKEYVEKHFSKNPGTIDGPCYPITFSQAGHWYEAFLNERLEHYGDYQDAISRDHTFLFHSVLTPSLNIGLITPEEVIRRVLEEQQRVPLNCLEGFVRQIIGWREYVRAVYHLIGSEERTRNFWGHTRKIPMSFWNGTTGIEPIDTVIRRVLETGYANHIERLMILGNFMLLCEFDPDDVYRWFMALFIDAYDWVMVPNVYGMSQYADGGMIVTKPYISSSNYVRKMSDFKAGPWCEVWDGLYWNFVAKHRDFFANNPRMKIMASQIDRMDPAKLTAHQQAARRFLDTLDECQACA